MRLLSALRLLVMVEFGVVLLLAIGVKPAHSQAWLNEMPEPGRVMRDIHGSDEIDTAARQNAALFFLRHIIEQRNLAANMPPAAKAKWQSYRDAEVSVGQRMRPNFDANCKGQDCPQARYMRLINLDYGLGSRFQQEILNRYFSAQWRKEYAEAMRPRSTQGSVQKSRSAEAPGQWAFIFLLSLISLGIGASLALVGHRRVRARYEYEFKHRTAGGSSSSIPTSPPSGTWWH